MQTTEAFVIPKDPRLSLSMLFPRIHDAPLPAPLDCRKTYHLFWARNAIYHGLGALGLEPGDNVLVPSFHCTSVVEPILKYGAEVKFYEIESDLQPNLTDIEAKMDGRTRALLIIHYFGFPQDIMGLKRFCANRKLYLIEDCAHVLRGKTEDGTVLGSIGDFSIFSWRKFLPIYDGGQLVVNNPDLNVKIPCQKSDFVFSVKVAKNTFDKLITDASHKAANNMVLISRISSGIARSLLSRNGHATMAFSVNSYDLNFDLTSLNLRMSGLSKRILQNTDIGDVVAKRRANYFCLLGAVRGLPGVRPLHTELPVGICPWVFPLLAESLKDLHLILRARGIPAITWNGVIHRDLPLDQFPGSRRFYDGLVFLPIHQSMEAQHLQIMARILGEVLHGKLQVDEKGSDGRLSLSAV
jgi:perosamine synthetase